MQAIKQERGRERDGDLEKGRRTKAIKGVLGGGERMAKEKGRDGGNERVRVGT